MKFRTASGQTGHDAYMFEASAIANAQRELDERFKRLLTAAHEEQPELFENDTDFHPQINGQATHAKSFGHYLRGRDHYIAWLRGGQRD